MAWTASLPAVVTGNPTKASDYNNLLNNVLFRRDTATGDVTQHVVAVGSDGSAAAPAIKRNADATGFYFAAGVVNIAVAGVQMVSVSSGAITLTGVAASQPVIQCLINGAAAGSGVGYVGLYVGSGAAFSGAISAISVGALAATGGNSVAVLTVASISTAATVYGINAGNLVSTVAGASGITIGNITAGGSGSAAGITIGAITGTGNGLAYGINIGAVTNGSNLSYSFYSAGSVALLHNGAPIRIGGGDAAANMLLASTLTITSAQGTVTATNAYAVKGTGSAGLVQAIWIKVYAGTTAYYVPAWATV